MNGTLEEQQYKMMVEAPIKPLILKLAAPTVVSMLVTALYNMADSYFVSQMGKSASGAVGVVFSLMAIMQAIGFTLGMGAGSIISRALGARDHARANMLGTTAFFSAIVCGLLLTVFGSIFLSPLMLGLGATDTILPYAKAYAAYILLGAPIMMASFVMNNVLRAQGKARFSMIGLASGGLLNIALDPLCIFGFGWGIAGAAIATLFSQAVSFLLLLSFFLRKKSVVEIRLKNMSRHGRDYADIVKTGLPSLCRQGLASIATILLNTQAAVYGDAALSAMSIVFRIFMFVFCIGLGIGQGYQPVMGYNYSAGKWGRVRIACLFTYVLDFCIMLVCGAVVFVFAPQIMPIFIKDATVVEIGTHALRYQAIVIPFLMTNVMCNMTFQSLGRKCKATLLSCCRQGIFYIPLVLLLPRFLGVTGIELAQAASDFCTFLVSIPFLFLFFREIRGKEKTALERMAE